MQPKRSKTRPSPRQADGAAPIIVFNTLAGKKERFIPIVPGHVGFYACGPTVYDYAHIGNLRTYLFEDFLKRVLEYNGLEVKHVMNITDVGHLVSDADEGEDKMEKGARREGKDIWEISRMYADAFFRDCKRLNILEPTVVCKATDHIPEQISLIQALEKKGYTYRTDDGIYFDSTKFAGYGKLGNIEIEGLEAGKRVSVREKRHPTDFALWKFSPKGAKRQMEWESPWGVGFPGWHIECSAMSMKYLGDRFDIHAGGTDLIPIHHNNEIAQDEAAVGHKVVDYWMHGAFLVLLSGKMSKSKGESLLVDLLVQKGFDPLDYRYLCLGTSYRKPLDFSWEILGAARDEFSRLKREVARLKKEAAHEGASQTAEQYDVEFLEAVNDDLNLREAVGVLRRLLKDTKIPAAQRYASVLKYDKVLGLGLDSVSEPAVPKEIIDLAEKREKARKEKDWKLADEIRRKISEKGFAIEDKPDGYQIIG